MIETIYAAIGIVAGNIAILVGYLGYILPETERCVEERKKMLDVKLNTKVDASLVGKTLGEIIVAGLGDLQHHVIESRQIREWQGMFKNMKDDFIFSVATSLAAIILTVLTFPVEMMQGFPFPEVLLVVSATYFVLFAYHSLNHRADLHKWKYHKEKESASEA